MLLLTAGLLPGVAAILFLEAFCYLSLNKESTEGNLVDHPELAPADRHIWVTSRLPWLHLDEHLPQEDGEAL